MGRIVHFEVTDDYCYAVGDASRSYGNGKVKRFLRHFLHLYPDLVIVLDDVVTTDPSFLHALLALPAEDRRAKEKRWTITAKKNGSRVEIEIHRQSGGGRPAIKETWRQDGDGWLRRK